ncbi:MAG: hypothetical protein HRU07_05725 [Nitrosopumilus sp.]|nr:hypothetical protein [Nitrosopumilus sp.]NRA05645.1 hypothetical protein [Nitrosopumilus sp.]
MPRKIKKVSLNTGISSKTMIKFIKFVKKQHHGVIKGPMSFETERAILLLLAIYDV